MAAKPNHTFSKIDYLVDGLKCPICFEFPRDPIETDCCHKILCKICMEEWQHGCMEEWKRTHGGKTDGFVELCLYCKKKLTYSGSMIAMRIIHKLDHHCEFCNEKIKKGDIKSHNLKCEKFKQTCPLCKEYSEQASLMNHLKEKHKEDTMKRMNKIIANFYLKNTEKNEIILTIDALTNSNLKVAKLGKSGKYYCKTNLYGPKCSCCNGTCGGKNMSGCNCSACMELDITSRRLPKGEWLVNSAGFNATKSSSNGLFYCGRRVLANNLPCQPNGDNCESCKKLNKMEKDTYHLLINQPKKLTKKSSAMYAKKQS